MIKSFWVYILCSQKRGTLYVGVTNNLMRRVYEHKHSLIPGFTAKYNVKRLVYAQEFPDSISALSREKLLKRWNRAWKIQLIEESNPLWEDLYDRE